MKILILEDDCSRVRVFTDNLYRHDLTITECSYDAIDHIKQTTFDCIFLDHDLGDGNGIGTDVSSYLKYNQDNSNYGAKIFIHSWNTPGVRNMTTDLPHAEWVPFHSLEFYDSLRNAGSNT